MNIDIYTAGCVRDEYGATMASLWKNGGLVDLHPAGSAWSYVCALAAANGKLIAAGAYSEPGGSKACLWTNGVKTDLPGGGESCALAIALDGGKVYAAGFYLESGVSKACYWAAEKRIELPSYGEGEARALAVSAEGGKVIIAGSYSQNGASKPGVWSGGEEGVSLLKLPELPTGFSASAFAVSGGKVYAAGSRKNKDGGYNSCYWVDNKITELPVQGASPSAGMGAGALSVSNGEVYAAGYCYAGENRACYWAAGKYHDLGGNFSVRAVASYSGKVYAAGFGGGKACFWEDGKRTELPGGIRGAKALAIALEPQ